jgi:hypothetical protein
MKKALGRTIQRLNYSISSQELLKIVERSDGDMRHAMNMAQLAHNRQAAAPKKRSDSKAKKNSALTSLNACSLDDGESEELSRDPFVSDFHILGKLLHSKNIKLDTSATQSTGRGAASTSKESKLVDFDRILDSSVMQLDRVLSLLHSNCTEYFTEIEDLDDALSLMSQSEVWLHGAYRTTSSSAVSSISLYLPLHYGHHAHIYVVMITVGVQVIARYRPLRGRALDRTHQQAPGAVSVSAHHSTSNVRDYEAHGLESRRIAAPTAGNDRRQQLVVSVLMSRRCVRVRDPTVRERHAPASPCMVH